MVDYNKIDALGRKAAHAAMKGAADYIKAQGLKIAETDYAPLTVAIREQAKAALPGALDDAQEAFEARMFFVGEATFLASMTQAGIKAVKVYQTEAN